jgi:hypothetical protein
MVMENAVHRYIITKVISGIAEQKVNWMRPAFCLPDPVPTKKKRHPGEGICLFYENNQTF